jgi:hypothetical protein
MNVMMVARSRGQRGRAKATLDLIDTCYIDAESWERHKRTEEAEQETVRKIAERMIEA